MHSTEIPGSRRDKRLFTPGPLTTSASVKQAMLHDVGSRDPEFIALVQNIRQSLLALAGVGRDRGFESIPIQGSGTYGVESVLSSVMPASGKLLVLVNGAYGQRMVEIAQRHGIPVMVVRSAEDRLPDLREVDRMLGADPGLTHVAMVHCETTSGILNPVRDIGAMVKRHGKEFIVDAMSSFGAIPLDLEAGGVDYLVSSANKCIEGVPGFGFIIARREALLGLEGRARTFSLDLLAQWHGLEGNGQFRFTPPTHAILAFVQALKELQAEGGVAGRGARYRENQRTLIEGMTALGFKPYLKPEVQSCVITTFHYPQEPRFQFEDFYRRLAARGFVIYPGKLTALDCFRIGTIGRIDATDVRELVAAVRGVLEEMGMAVPLGHDLSL